MQMFTVDIYFSLFLTTAPGRGYQVCSIQAMSYCFPMRTAQWHMKLKEFDLLDVKLSRSIKCAH